MVSASRDVRRAAKAMAVEVPVEKITKTIGGEKNGGSRTIIKNKGPKWYPADDVKKPVGTRKNIHKPTRLRPSIKPGSVLILLAGRFRGMRVVFLKQLSSGLLLVTGPYAVNGVPLRRVDQRYVITTSTKVDISKADVSKVEDAFFKRESTDADDELMEDAAEPKKKPLPENKIAMQKSVDAALVPAVEKVPFLKEYLKSKFTLAKGLHPHQMKF